MRSLPASPAHHVDDGAPLADEMMAMTRMIAYMTSTLDFAHV